jgi:polyadenylate-binding protein
MEKKEDAENALQAMNGTEIGGSVIEVTHYVPRDQRSQNWTNCYFKFLPQSMDEKDAMAFFATIGPVTSLFLPTPRVAKEGAVNAGYGFVNFENHEVAVQAVEQLNGHQFGETKSEEEESTPGFFIQKQMPKREQAERRRQRKEDRRRVLNQRYAGRNLYIRNIPLTYTEENLQSKFTPFGEVVSVRLDKDYVTRAPTGVGYVCMSTVEGAQKALTDLAGIYLDDKPLVVQLFKTKEERQREVAQRKQ